MPGLRGTGMSVSNSRVGRLSSRAWHRLERCVADFERAWEQGPRPNIDDFLGGETRGRQVLLSELVLSDLEYRLRAGEPARVEEYLGRYPDLAADGKQVVELLVA